MNNLTTKQIQAILDGAPEGAIEHCLYDYGDSTYPIYLNCENQFYEDGEKEWVEMCLVDNYFHSRRRLTDLNEILALRQEVELLKALNNGLKAPTARCNTRFICIVCGKGGGSLLNIRPPQSYNCSHCEIKNTMLPKHVHDAVKAQQSEVAARAVESLIENETSIFRLHNGEKRSGIFCQDAKQFANQLREYRDE